MLARVFVIIMCLAAVAASPAHAAPGDDDWSWEPFGPVGNTDGFVAAAVDPTNPRVFWIAGSSSVWVSDDGGDTFSLVLHMSRASGSSRSSSPLEDDDDIVRDFDSVDPTDFEAEDPTFDGLPDEGLEESGDIEGDGEVLFDDEGLVLDEGEDESDLVAEEAEDGEVSEDRQAAFVRTAFGITRLRVIGADVWVCSSRGLWRIPTAARRLGEASEVRFGRRLGVNDVADGGGGRLYVGTDAGLWVVDQGLGRRVRGVEFDATVFSLATIEMRLFAATSLGLYRGDMGVDVFARSAAGGRGEGALVDLLPTAEGLLAADGNRVFAYGRDGQQVLEAWQVPGASRLFVGADKRLWAVGPRGPWVYDGQFGWNRRDETLSDRRLRDGFALAPADPTAPDTVGSVCIVGLAGAWRMISGRLALTPAQRLERAMKRAFERRPTLASVIATADARRVLTLDRIDGFATREQLAWLAPMIQVRFRAQQQRDERRTLVPAVGQRFLDMVDVEPQNNLFEVMAWWDLMPAILASLDASRSRVYENARIQARRNMRRVREAIPSLYRNWQQQQKAVWQTEYRTPREAVRAMLGVAQVEAQLHAMTAGTFPTTSNPENYFYPPEDER